VNSAPAASGYHSHHPTKNYQSLIWSREISVNFRYHSESAQTINSSKETKKSYRRSSRSKTTAAVHPGPLYNFHKFGISASQDHLHESHIRNLKSQCSSSYKSELRLGHFILKTLLLQRSLTRSLGTFLLAYLLLDGSSRTRIYKRIPEKSKSYPQYLTVSMQSNLRSLSGHLFDATLPLLKRKKQKKKSTL
jgi:hypothetical protein